MAWAVVALLALCSLPSLAISAGEDPTRTLKQTIESRFPGTRVVGIQPSGIAGVYEIFMGDQIVYADASGDHVLMGPLVDTRTRENLTERHLDERGRIDFHALPLEKAIKVVRGNGGRVFAVFSDPDCPYCQRLEKSLQPVTNITMYVFLYPIASLHPEATAKSLALWCAPDRAKAWEEWMQDKKLPAASKCPAAPLAALQKLGEQLNVNSTPTMFFADGRRVAGAIGTAELEGALNADGVAKAASASPPPTSTSPNGAKQ